MFKIIRVHLKLAVPVWHSGLTQQLSADIERIQSIAVSFILGDYQLPYDQACTMLGLKPLYIRGMELCQRFAIKTAGIVTFSSWKKMVPTIHVAGNITVGN